MLPSSPHCHKVCLLLFWFSFVYLLFATSFCAIHFFYLVTQYIYCFVSLSYSLPGLLCACACMWRWAASCWAVVSAFNELRRCTFAVFVVFALLCLPLYFFVFFCFLSLCLLLLMAFEFLFLYLFQHFYFMLILCVTCIFIAALPIA